MIRAGGENQGKVGKKDTWAWGWGIASLKMYRKDLSEKIVLE